MVAPKRTLSKQDRVFLDALRECLRLGRLYTRYPDIALVWDSWPKDAGNGVTYDRRDRARRF